MLEEQPDFISLLGTETADRAFLDAWASGRVPHAWLIAGPKGTGKACFAAKVACFVLAQVGVNQNALFDAPPAALDIAPDHPVLRRVLARSHADFRILRRGWSDEGKRKSEISVDEVREIGAFLSMTPAEGGWRVVIVDSADEMNRNSANALLKILEEPPDNSLLLIVSHNPGRLLPTIRSRCRKLNFHPLSDKDVETVLQRKVANMTPDEKALLLERSEGSVGRALALHEQGGLSSHQEMMKLLNSLPRLDIPALHLFAEMAGKNEATFRSTADLFSWRLGKAATDYVRYRSLPNARPECAEPFTRLVEMTGLDRWIEVWDKASRSFARTEAVALDRKQVIINAFVALEQVCRA